MLDRVLALAAGSLALVALLGGCAPTVGDQCESQSDCPSNAICDSTVPDGYCTIPDCTRGSCPGNSICVVFESDDSYCMKPCEDDADCRDQYTCRHEDYSRPFCYTSP